jgi:hypothetical protein
LSEGNFWVLCIFGIQLRLFLSHSCPYFMLVHFKDSLIIAGLLRMYERQKLFKMTKCTWIMLSLCPDCCAAEQHTSSLFFTHRTTASKQIP